MCGASILNVLHIDVFSLCISRRTLAASTSPTASGTSGCCARSGYVLSGYGCSGYVHTGYGRSGYVHTGYGRSGYVHTGYERSGYIHTGYRRSGYVHTGYERVVHVQRGYTRGWGQQHAYTWRWYSWVGTPDWVHSRMGTLTRKCSIQKGYEGMAGSVQKAWGWSGSLRWVQRHKCVAPRGRGRREGYYWTGCPMWGHPAAATHWETGHSGLGRPATPWSETGFELYSNGALDAPESTLRRSIAT